MSWNKDFSTVGWVLIFVFWFIQIGKNAGLIMLPIAIALQLAATLYFVYSMIAAFFISKAHFKTLGYYEATFALSTPIRVQGKFAEHRNALSHLAGC
jgi:hypothetical protein